MATNGITSLFGWEFKRKPPKDDTPSFVPESSDDGATIVAAAGAYGTYVDLDGVVRTEAELITKYRDMALQPEIDAAVDEVVNESIAIDEDEIISINVDGLTEVSANIKNKIREEFEIVYNLLNFKKYAYEIYRRWYIDGRLYYNVIIDDSKPREGIKELRYIDPRKIRKIREVIKKKVEGGVGQDALVPKTVNEYYVYNDKGFNFGNKSNSPATTGLKIARDAIVYVVSGLTDTQGSMVLSYLHPAIKPITQLRTLEDASVIYRLARAPERRIWYIDVGNLPKMKAEQYVRDIMTKHKNRLIYDSTTGEVKSDRKFLTMLEDFWLPRREGGRGTEVDTLPSGQILGEMDDILYFKKKLYQSLHVPVNRLDSDSLFSLGRATEVTRDEVKFAKFITRLRARFAQLFTDLLEKQLVLKGIVSLEDWENIAPDLKYDFSKDNYFTELKDGEVLSSRINLMNEIQPYLGIYYSHEWARKNILHQSDEEIEEMDAEIQEELDDPRWNMVTMDDMNNNDMNQNPNQQQFGGQPTANQMVNKDEEDPNTAYAEKTKKLQQAKTTVNLLKNKKDRTMKEEADYKSAYMILARNK